VAAMSLATSKDQARVAASRHCAAVITSPKIFQLLPSKRPNCMLRIGTPMVGDVSTLIPGSIIPGTKFMFRAWRMIFSRETSSLHCSRTRIRPWAVR